MLLFLNSFRFKLLIFFCTLVFSNGYAQVHFEKGYIIDNENKKTECFIKNQDWIFNPKDVVYKLNINDKAQTGEITNISEFTVPGQFKYIKANVDIDKSSDLLQDNEISNTSFPNWEKRNVFLKVLVEGDLALLVFEENNFIRFFYQRKNQSPQQLIFKRFKPAESMDYFYNREYLKQLQELSKCTNISEADIQKIKYSQSELMKFFIDMNDCVGSNINVYKQKRQKWLSLKPLVGATFGKFKTGNDIDTSISNISFSSATSFMAGVEVEFILPFKKSTWSFPLDISSFSYKSSGTKTDGSVAKIDYNTIDISGGFRHYFFVTDDFKILLDLRYTKDIKVTLGTFSAGVGFGYKKINISSEFFLKKRMDDLYDYLSQSRSFKVMTLSLRYAIL